MAPRSDPPSLTRLHRCATALAALVVLLIAAGALVKSLEAGLSVPDWPTSYGGINPPGWWRIENVRAEHGHRLFAGSVALLTVGLALWVQRREERRWVRRVAWLAVAAVFAQAVLGGITVLFFLPLAVSTAHAALAELFLALLVTLALATSCSWRREPRELPEPAARRLLPLAKAAPAAVFVQILVGAVMRHAEAGLAIPDFPLIFGGLLPPHWSFGIAVHFLHRLGALALLLLALWTFVRTREVARGRRDLVIPAALFLALLLVQVGLGGAVVLSGRAVWINTLHVATGAVTFAVAVIFALNAGRAVPVFVRQKAGTRVQVEVAGAR